MLERTLSLWSLVALMKASIFCFVAIVAIAAGVNISMAMSLSLRLGTSPMRCIRCAKHMSKNSRRVIDTTWCAPSVPSVVLAYTDSLISVCTTVLRSLHSSCDCNYIHEVVQGNNWPPTKPTITGRSTLDRALSPDPVRTPYSCVFSYLRE